MPAKLAATISIRQARKRVGVTQAALARMAGVTEAAISQLEHPDSNRTIDTLSKVARALGAELRVELVGANAVRCHHPPSHSGSFSGHGFR